MNSIERRREIDLIRGARTRGVDFWTEKVIYPFSYQLVFAIRNKAITPNHLTLAGLLIGIASAVLIGLPMRTMNIFGSIGIQVAFCFDCADGQLARYRKMESPFGRWLDDMSGVLIYSLYLMALATQQFRRVQDEGVLIWAIFSCFVTAFYTLHRELRDNLFNKYPIASSKTFHIPTARITSAKFLKLNIFLLISVGILINKIMLTIVSITLYHLALFLVSAFYFIAICSKPTGIALENDSASKEYLKRHIGD